MIANRPKTECNHQGPNDMRCLVSHARIHHEETTNNEDVPQQPVQWEVLMHQPPQPCTNHEHPPVHRRVCMILINPDRSSRGQIKIYVSDGYRSLSFFLFTRRKKNQPDLMIAAMVRAKLEFEFVCTRC